MMGPLLVQAHPPVSLILLGLLLSIVFTAPYPVLGAASGIAEHALSLSTITSYPHKKLVKRPHGQGWREPNGEFIESRRSRQCLPAFGYLPIEDCLSIVTDILPQADEVRRQFYHMPRDRVTDKPNVQMPIEHTIGICTLKITPTYPISGSTTAVKWDTATWRQMRNIAIALAYGCPGGNPGWGGFQQAGDHGNLMISFYDKAKADESKRRQAELDMMKSLSSKKITIAELDRVMRDWKVSSMGATQGGTSCSSGSGAPDSKTCTADDPPPECSDAYSHDASNCCLGYTYSEKPISSTVSRILLGFKSITASTLSAGASAIGWCEPVQLDSYI